MGEPNEPPEKTTADVHRALMDQVRVIRDRRKMSIPDVLTKYAGPAIAREYRRCIAEMAAELGESGA